MFWWSNSDLTIATQDNAWYFNTSNYHFLNVNNTPTYQKGISHTTPDLTISNSHNASNWQVMPQKMIGKTHNDHFPIFFEIDLLVYNLYVARWRLCEWLDLEVGGKIFWKEVDWKLDLLYKYVTLVGVVWWARDELLSYLLCFIWIWFGKGSWGWNFWQI